MKSRLHTLYNSIKANAELKGYKTEIKKSSDYVDRIILSIERNGRRKACEICTEMPEKGQVYTIWKYFADGYDTVIFISTDAQILRQIEQQIIPPISVDQQPHVFFFDFKAFSFYLNTELAEDAAYTTTYKGYTVHVRFDPITDEEAELKRKQILNALLRAEIQAFKERNAKS